MKQLTNASLDHVYHCEPIVSVLRRHVTQQPGMVYDSYSCGTAEQILCYFIFCSPDHVAVEIPDVVSDYTSNVNVYYATILCIRGRLHDSVYSRRKWY